MKKIAGFFTWLVFISSAAALGAQDPVIQLERRDLAEANAWTGRTTLAFRVTLLHPAMRPGAGDGDFVLDPPGGWRGAIHLVVTDAAGKAVDWLFENLGRNIDQSLSLHRLGTASVSFLLEPKPNGVVFPVGRYEVSARLASTSGKWRGRVSSPPVAVEFVGRAQPELEVTGLDEGPLMRGWPLLVGVKITAPDGFDGGLSLPTAEKDWQSAMSLTLADGTGAPVALIIDRLPFAPAELGQAQLNARESRTIWFRVSAEATQTLGEGPYHWTAKFTLPEASPAPYQWSGSMSAKTVPTRVLTPPVTLSGEIARRHTWAQVEDGLVEAKLVRAYAENGSMNEQMAAAQQAAVPLQRAERLALQWYQANPGDPSGAVLMASVMVAEEDKFRAVDYLRQAIEADLRQRSPADGGGPSLSLRMMLLQYEALPDESHAVLTPALRAALHQIRTADLPLTAAAPLPPETTVASVPALAPEPVPAPGELATAPVSIPSAASSAGSVEPPPVAEAAHGKIVAANELADVKVIADPAGQWATSATAGTKYGKTQYAPAQATGAPNISIAGNSPDAWSPENKTGGTDWLEVGFAKPVHATEVRVRQNDSVGAIAKIEAIEPDGTAHVWWEGVDPYVAPAVREIVWFAVRVPPTPYLVAKVKITLNLSATPGWKEIDAVQLVGAGS